MSDTKKRCKWAEADPLYVDYHDQEWGVAIYDDQRLFEFLTLESAQAGLSWLTILKKRDNYRKAFAHFDVERVAKFDDNDIEGLMLNPGIVRNRLKITSAVTNAKCFLDIQKEFGSFSAYQWRFVDGAPRQNNWTDGSQVPAVTVEAEAFSKDLKKRGFRFVGPTIIYAHMQAAGMVNDHITECFRYKEVAE